MAYAQPADGYAYSPIELTGLAHIPVDRKHILDGLVRRGAFFRATGDTKNAALIVRAIVADFIDPTPAFESDATNTEGEVK